MSPFSVRISDEEITYPRQQEIYKLTLQAVQDNKIHLISYIKNLTNGEFSVEYPRLYLDNNQRLALVSSILSRDWSMLKHKTALADIVGFMK